MSRLSRDKVRRTERRLVNLHRDAGIDAEREPLSGAGGLLAGDLIVDGLGRAELNARGGGAGFALLQRWLADHDALLLRRDRRTSLLVLPWRPYVRLMTRRDDAINRAVI